MLLTQFSKETSQDKMSQRGLEISLGGVMKEYLLKHKMPLVMNVLLRSLGAAMQVYVAILIQKIIDSAMAKDTREFINILMFSVIFVYIHAITGYLTKAIQFIYVKKTITDLKSHIFRGILRKSYKQFNDEDTANYISKLTNDINMVENKLVIPSLELVSDIVIFVGTTILLLWINVWITIVMFLTATLLFIVPALFWKKIGNGQKEVSTQFEIYTTKIKDIFSGYEVIKSYNLEKNVTDEFLDANSNVEELKYKVNNLQGISESLSFFLGIMTQISAIALGGYFLIKGQLTVGTLFAVVQLGNGIYQPIMWIANKITIIKSMKGINSRILEIINNKTNNKEYESLEGFFNSIEFKNVSFSYDNNNSVLNSFSQTFEKNRKYAIVGSSGSGKSTILKLLQGYYEEFHGEIYFDNKEYKSLNKDSIKNQVSIIHQNVYMFNKSLKENIVLGKFFNEHLLKSIIMKSGLYKFLDMLPNGLDSSMGENGNVLSGGQKQRVAIARAIIQDTPILLLDEGTSALDNQTAFEIEDTLLDIENLTIITVTHKLTENILKKYDEIIVVDKGQVVEKGSFYELLNNKKDFHNMYYINSQDIE